MQSSKALRLKKEEQAKVVRVIDGDTIVAEVGESRKKVRIIGIDTPESVKKDHPVECFRKKASAKTEQRLQGKSVKLIYDIEREDKYGRTLAYVHRGKEDHGLWLIKHGHARTLPIEPNTNRRTRYSDSEDQARDAARGLWGACG